MNGSHFHCIRQPAPVHAAVYRKNTVKAHLMAGPQGAVQEAKLARVHCAAESAPTQQNGPLLTANITLASVDMEYGSVGHSRHCLQQLHSRSPCQCSRSL